MFLIDVLLQMLASDLVSAVFDRRRAARPAKRDAEGWFIIRYGFFRMIRWQGDLIEFGRRGGAKQVQPMAGTVSVRRSIDIEVSFSEGRSLRLPASAQGADQFFATLSAVVAEKRSRRPFSRKSGQKNVRRLM
ncbi:hypothetical protein FHS96_000363 [Sphingomonas zeicaulis]|uniref:hypothetical protein n=1 Tax=Sphingomonas zeicaulis TaxID=1632740 RepID=UPI003D1BAF0C